MFNKFSAPLLGAAALLASAVASPVLAQADLTTSPTAVSACAARNATVVSVERLATNQLRITCSRVVATGADLGTLGAAGAVGAGALLIAVLADDDSSTTTTTGTN